MRTFIYAIHLFAVALLLFSKSTPPVKKAKLTFVVQKPMSQTLAVSSHQGSKQPAKAETKVVKTQDSSHPTPPAQTQQKKTEKPPAPKPKVTTKKESKPTQTKKIKETPKPKPSPEKALISEEKKTKEMESLKKIESLLEELNAPKAPIAEKKKTAPKSSQRAIGLPEIQSTPLETGGVAFDGDGFQQLLFDELQLPQAGEVELELEILDGSLKIAKIVRTQNDENLAYLLKKIPQIELGNCKKIAGLENGMRLRIIFCTKPL